MIQVGALPIMEWGAHFFSVAAAMVLFGAALFPVYTGMEGWPHPWTRLTPLVLASVLLVGFVLTVSLTLLSFTGDVASLVSPDELEGFFLETSFGPVWLAGLLLSATLFAVALAYAIPANLPELRYRQREILVLILSAGVIVSFAATGHARSTSDGKASIAVGSEILHILAAAAWIGGLPPLFLHLRHSKHDVPAKISTLPMLYSFSFMGQWAVAILILGGVSTLAVLLAAWHVKLINLSVNAYTFTLFIKLLLLSITLGIAAINRFVLIPGLKKNGEGTTRLRQMVLAECILIILIIIAATTLSRLPPPM